MSANRVVDSQLSRVLSPKLTIRSLRTAGILSDLILSELRVS